jgi:hypothetical protein
MNILRNIAVFFPVISSIPPIKWSLKHEAAALSAYLKRFEE